MAVEHARGRTQEIEILLDLFDDPGRRTLTATSRPFASSARWICAIDAVARGSGSNRENRSGSRSSRMTASISSNATGGTSSTRRSSSSM
jgi:hypothetical protein